MTLSFLSFLEILLHQAVNSDNLRYFKPQLQEFNPETQYDIKILDTKTNETSIYRKTPSQDTSPVFSPDGRWIVFVSNHENEQQFEVFVSAFPDMKEIEKISVNGGILPRWNPNGKELFYIEGQQMMSVKVDLGEKFEYNTPHELFKLDIPILWFLSPYDYNPDTDSFLIIEPQHGRYFHEINVVTNWFEIIKQRDPEWNK